MMLDHAVLKHFRDEAHREGRCYQTAINAALRDWIRAQKARSDERPLTVGTQRKVLAEVLKR